MSKEEDAYAMGNDEDERNELMAIIGSGDSYGSTKNNHEDKSLQVGERLCSTLEIGFNYRAFSPIPCLSFHLNIFRSSSIDDTN